MNILEEAEAIIHGDRERVYGRPDKNLRNIAALWVSYMRMRFSLDVPLGPEDICAMMRLLKEARLINQPNHRDSLVDICGYTALQAKILNCDAGRQGKAESPQVD